MTTRHLAAIGLLLAGSAGAQTLHPGSLQAGDDRLDGGEWVDSYRVELRAGQPFEADLTSSDFDPYLILRAPSGAQEENDDYLGSTMHARIVTTAAETGTYTVAVTSYAAGETGAYRLEIEAGHAPVVTPPPPTRGPVASGPSRGPSAPAATRAEIAGHWVGGSVTATQYRDRDTGASAPTNGIGTTLDLGADGTYRQTRVMNQTTYGCTSTVHVDERGTYAVENGDLVLHRQSGRSWGQVCGGAPYDRTLEPETERFAVTVAPGRGGVATLTRSQDGEFFDELERGS
ncbi:PPC domain-containing protein [Rubrivirga marina]|uniref:Peptidase C-terminal archaeal/bacterial domain-containing protein n=1 Tax=Rubrivirga marina TaxID=1196024 RepID=A0A271IZ44_9BACT|nr:PPC domain-containing protein [Rubrivirga marina]PAP75975.1 hypothetical protein BSZ37_05730 [Rubrivirga marina]